MTTAPECTIKILDHQTKKKLAGWEEKLKEFSTVVIKVTEPKPGWRGVWGRTDTPINEAEPLCCPPEAITTQLISYTPIQIKKFFFFLKKERK